jgi:hypothetical protein
MSGQQQSPGHYERLQYQTSQLLLVFHFFVLYPEKKKQAVTNNFTSNILIIQPTGTGVQYTSTMTWKLECLRYWNILFKRDASPGV